MMKSSSETDSRFQLYNNVFVVLLYVYASKLLFVFSRNNIIAKGRESSNVVPFSSLNSRDVLRLDDLLYIFLL